MPWTLGAEDVFRRWFGYSALENLDAFRVTNPQELSPRQKQVRLDLHDFWSRRFRDAYLQPLRDWTRKHGLAQGAHFNGDDASTGIIPVE